MKHKKKSGKFIKFNEKLKEITMQKQKNLIFIIFLILPIFSFAVRSHNNVIKGVQYECELSKTLLNISERSLNPYAKPFSPGQPQKENKLFVGEGNFSYTLSYLRQHISSDNLHVVPTELDIMYNDEKTKKSMEELEKTYKVRCYNKVDVTKLSENPDIKADMVEHGAYDTIAFNFPFVKESRSPGPTPTIPMLREFFKEAHWAGNEKCRIHMAIIDAPYHRGRYGLNSELLPSDGTLFGEWSKEKTEKFDLRKHKNYGYRHKTSHTTEAAPSVQDHEKDLRVLIFKKKI